MKLNKRNLYFKLTLVGIIMLVLHSCASTDDIVYYQDVDEIAELNVPPVQKIVLKPGDKLPSVREYAIETGVNVNTVQRVYKELETLELTETKRGQGTFMTTNEQRINQLREDMKEQVATQFITAIQSLGFSTEEMLEVLKKKG